MVTKKTIEIEKEKREARIKELHRLRYWCKHCNKLFSDVRVLHTGNGNLCPKCGKEVIDKK